MTGGEQALVWLVGIFFGCLSVSDIVGKYAEVRKARWLYKKHELYMSHPVEQEDKESL